MNERKGQTKSAVKQPEQAQELKGLIAQKACQLYERSGRIEGRDLDNWLEAERLVRAEGQIES